MNWISRSGTERLMNYMAQRKWLKTKSEDNLYHYHGTMFWCHESKSWGNKGFQDNNIKRSSYNQATQGNDQFVLWNDAVKFSPLQSERTPAFQYNWARLYSHDKQIPRFFDELYRRYHLFWWLSWTRPRHGQTSRSRNWCWIFKRHRWPENQNTFYCKRAMSSYMLLLETSKRQYGRLIENT